MVTHVSKAAINVSRTSTEVKIQCLRRVCSAPLTSIYPPTVAARCLCSRSSRAPAGIHRPPTTVHLVHPGGSRRDLCDILTAPTWGYSRLTQAPGGLRHMPADAPHGLAGQ